MSAANRLPALFVQLIYYLRTAIVSSHPNVCSRALTQSLCKWPAREVLVRSFQLFPTRHFLQPHPSTPAPYSKLGWPGSSSLLIPLAHNKQRQHSVLPGQDLPFINLHGRQWQQTFYGNLQALANHFPKQAGTLKSSSQQAAALLQVQTVSDATATHSITLSARQLPSLLHSRALDSQFGWTPFHKNKENIHK